jgi:hypothetical protein
VQRLWCFVIFCGLTLVAGCKGKASTQASAGAGSGSGQGSGSGSGSGAPLTVPKADGSPPRKSPSITRPVVEKLKAMEFPGFVKMIRDATDNTIEIRYRTQARPLLSIEVTAGPCFKCVPMALAAWKSEEPRLKALIPAEIRERPDTVFELGATQLGATPMIFIYQLAHFFGKADDGQPVATYSHAYTLHFNDGVNQIRVVAKYSDDAGTRDKMGEL